MRLRPKFYRFVDSADLRHQDCTGSLSRAVPGGGPDAGRRGAYGVSVMLDTPRAAPVTRLLAVTLFPDPDVWMLKP